MIWSLGATELYYALERAEACLLVYQQTDPLFYLQACGAMGARLYHRTKRCGGHLEPLRCQWGGPL